MMQRKKTLENFPVPSYPSYPCSIQLFLAMTEQYYKAILRQKDEILKGLLDFIHGRYISHNIIRTSLGSLGSYQTASPYLMKQLTLALLSNSQERFLGVLTTNNRDIHPATVLFFLWIAAMADKKDWTGFLVNLLPQSTLLEALNQATTLGDLDCVRSILSREFILTAKIVDDLIPTTSLPIITLMLETLQRGKAFPAKFAKGTGFLPAAQMMEPGWLRTQLLSGSNEIRLSSEQLIKIEISRLKKANIDFLSREEYFKLGGIEYVLSVVAVLYHNETHETNLQIFHLLGVDQDFMDCFSSKFASEWSNTKTFRDQVQALSRRGFSLNLPLNPFDPTLTEEECMKALKAYKFYEAIKRFGNDSIASSLHNDAELSEKKPRTKSKESKKTMMVSEIKTNGMLVVQEQDDSKCSTDSGVQSSVRRSESESLYESMQKSSQESLQDQIAHVVAKSANDDNSPADTSSQTQSIAPGHVDAMDDAGNLADMSRSWIPDDPSAADLSGSSLGQAANIGQSDVDQSMLDISKSDLGQSMVDLTMSATLSMSEWSCVSETAETMTMSQDGSAMSIDHQVSATAPIVRPQPAIVITPPPQPGTERLSLHSEQANLGDNAKSRTTSPTLSPVKPGLLRKPKIKVASLTESLSGSDMSIDEPALVFAPVSSLSSQVRRTLSFQDESGVAQRDEDKKFPKAEKAQAQAMVEDKHDGDKEEVTLTRISPVDGYAKYAARKLDGKSAVLAQDRVNANTNRAPKAIVQNVPQAGANATLDASHAFLNFDDSLDAELPMDDPHANPAVNESSQDDEQTTDDEFTDLWSSRALTKEMVGTARLVVTDSAWYAKFVDTGSTAAVLQPPSTTKMYQNDGPKEMHPPSYTNANAGPWFMLGMNEFLGSDDDDDEEPSRLEASGSTPIVSPDALVMLPPIDDLLGSIEKEKAKTQDQDAAEDKETASPIQQELDDKGKTENRERPESVVTQPVRTNRSLKMNRQRGVSLPHSFKLRTKKYVEMIEANAPLANDPTKEFQMESIVVNLNRKEPIDVNVTGQEDIPPGQNDVPNQEEVDQLSFEEPVNDEDQYLTADEKREIQIPVVFPQPQPVAGGHKFLQQEWSSPLSKAPLKDSKLKPSINVAEESVPSPQSVINKAFSSIKEMLQFVPVGSTTVTIDTFRHASKDIFSHIPSNVLQSMRFPETFHAALRAFFETEDGLAMLGHLVADGESSPYEHIGIMFPVLGPLAFDSLKKDAMPLINPVYFARLRQEHFALVDFSTLLPDQVKLIPAQFFTGLSLTQAIQFKTSSLDRDPAYSPCSGLTSDQLNALPSKNLFDAFGEACQKHINSEALYSSSKEVVSWIPTKFFELSLAYDQPGLESLIQNATIEQFSHIPQMYADESLSPFFGLKIDLASLGAQDHRRAMRTISPQTIEIVHPVTLQSMGSGDFALLSEHVRSNITCESFGYIPPTAVPIAEVSRLSTANSKLCAHLRPEHFYEMSSDVEISSACAGQLPKDTWSFLVSSGVRLPSSFLAHATGEHLSDLSCLSGSSLTAAHWSKLGKGLASGEEHPCESIRFVDVASDEEFWKGINLACCTALPCLDEITDMQFKLIKKSVRDHLPHAAIKGLPLKIQNKLSNPESTFIKPNMVTPTVLTTLTNNEIHAISSQDFAEFPLETLASLKKEHAKLFASNKALLEHVTAEIVAACSPEFLGSLTADQVDLIPAEACAGLTGDHLATVDLFLLPPTAFAFIEPIQFTHLSANQLARIPDEAWSSAIFKEQVESINPADLAEFNRFDQFGADVDPLSPQHPCLGITEGHKSSFKPSAHQAFLKQCKPVFDSQDLEKRINQRTKMSE